jgi:hypothetical protein
MKRRYRIRNTSDGYLPQVKYGWLPWWDIGNVFYLFGEGAKKACDRHNESQKRGVIKCEEYTPKPLTTDQ